MRIAVASDHRGYRRKENIKGILSELKHTPEDFGPFNEESVDYPDFAFQAVQAVACGDCERAILSCYTGVGMSIAANKVKGVRAALCYDKESVELSRRHNDANVLVLPARIDFGGSLSELVRMWIDLEFEGGRHQRRLDKISNYEGSE